MTIAQDFESEMMYIWDGPLHGPLYDEWHDARIRARHPKWDASDTGRIDDEWAEWEFGDGSKAWIARDGSGVYTEGQAGSSTNPAGGRKPPPILGSNQP